MLQFIATFVLSGAILGVLMYGGVRAAIAVGLLPAEWVAAPHKPIYQVATVSESSGTIWDSASVAVHVSTVVCVLTFTPIGQTKSTFGSDASSRAASPSTFAVFRK